MQKFLRSWASQKALEEEEIHQGLRGCEVGDQVGGGAQRGFTGSRYFALWLVDGAHFERLQQFAVRVDEEGRED